MRAKDIRNALTISLGCDSSELITDGELEATTWIGEDPERQFGALHEDLVGEVVDIELIAEAAVEVGGEGVVLRVGGNRVKSLLGTWAILLAKREPWPFMPAPKAKFLSRPSTIRYSLSRFSPSLNGT